MRDPDALARDAFSSPYNPRRPIEEQFRQLWRQLVGARSGVSWHTADSRRSDEGLPDEITLCRGRTLFVELKAPGKKATPKQRATIRMLNDYGHEAYLVTSTGDRGRDMVALADLLDRPPPPRAHHG